MKKDQRSFESWFSLFGESYCKDDCEICGGSPHLTKCDKCDGRGRCYHCDEDCSECGGLGRCDCYRAAKAEYAKIAAREKDKAEAMV